VALSFCLGESLPGRGGPLACYRALAVIFSRRMPGALATELSVTVAELDELVAATSPAIASPKNQGM
jgi:hypothetical protein